MTAQRCPRPCSPLRSSRAPLSISPPPRARCPPLRARCLARRSRCPTSPSLAAVPLATMLAAFASVVAFNPLSTAALVARLAALFLTLRAWPPSPCSPPPLLPLPAAPTSCRPARTSPRGLPLPWKRAARIAQRIRLDNAILVQDTRADSKPSTPYLCARLAAPLATLPAPLAFCSY